MKTTIAVTLDGELVVEARAKNIKFSQEFNNYLKSWLEVEEENPEALLEDRMINAKARVESLRMEMEKEKSKRDKEEGLHPPIQF